MAVWRMSTEFANIFWFQFKARKAFGKFVRVTWVPRGQADIKEEVEATIWSDNSNIANTDTLPLVWARKCRVGLRDPKRKTMLFELHMTLIDRVTGFFFNGIALCGWRLLGVSTLAKLTRETSNLDFGRYFAPTKAWMASQQKVRIEPSLLLENHWHDVPESVDTLNSSSELCSWFDADEVLEYGRSLTEDEVLAYGESATEPEEVGFLMAKGERDESESDPPRSKCLPMIRMSLKIWSMRTDILNECSSVMVPLRVNNFPTEHTGG
jgi:hypothetical protein